MKHVPFTNDIGDAIVTKLQEGFAKKQTKVGYSVMGDPLVGAGEYCYAPVAAKLQMGHDYFGILYQGWSGKICVQEYNAEARLWLEYLLNPEGAFSSLFPYMYKTTPDDIISDCGFIFKDLAKPKAPVNQSLMWCFLQATREMYENPARMDRFKYCAKHIEDKNLAVFCTLTLQPQDKSPKGQWVPTIASHGSPLGQTGTYRRAAPFLNVVVTKTAHIGTRGSGDCFGGPIDYDYRDRSPALSLSLDDWVKRFNEERKYGGKVAPKS